MSPRTTRALFPLLASAALAACDCTGVKTCVRDADCGRGAVCERGSCVLLGTEDAGPSCEPSCPAFARCAWDGGCEPRYAGIHLLSPRTGAVLDGGPAPVLAFLELAAGMTRADPDRLLLWASSLDGGVAPVSSELLRTDAGDFRGDWYPTGEGAFLLTAEYPDSGLASPGTSVQVDRTPPAFVLTPELQLGPPRPPDAGFVFADPGGTPLSLAWRRDETAVAEVRSVASDVDPLSVVVSVAAVPAGAPASFPVAPLTPCDAGFCGTVAIELWRPAFPAFRGTLALSIRGRDRVGNGGTSSAKPLLLTRWKWRFDPPTPSRILWPPAIGATGRVYAALSGQLTETSSLIALEPEGKLAWEETVASSKVMTSLFVGAPAPAAPDFLYGVRQQLLTDSTDYFIRAGDSGASIWGTGSTGANLIGPVAAVANPSGPGECWVHLASTTELRAVCPPSNYSGMATIHSASLVQAEYGVVANGNTVYLGQQDQSLRSFELEDGGFTGVAGFPLTQVPVGGLPSLAASSGLLLVPGSDLTAVTLVNPKVAWTYPGSASVGTPSAGQHPGSLYLGRGSTEVVRVAVGTGAADRTHATQRVSGSPSLGAGGRVHVVATDSLSKQSDLLELSGELEIAWTMSGLLSGATAPALDCGRSLGVPLPGRPGVLYVGDSTGSVFAFVVDTAGLDAAAQWPKLLRDPRNTNNAATPLGPFACP